MVRVKIVQKGWAGFTGNLGTAIFKDGIAELSQIEANRIGSIVGIVEVTEDDKELDVINIAHEMVRTRSLSSEVVPSRQSKIEETVEQEPETTEENEPENVLTREDLEAIADKDGIKGLRVFSEPLGVKSIKMSELIDKILEAQNAA